LGRYVRRPSEGNGEELIGLSRDKSSAFRKCTVAFAILARARTGGKLLP